MTNPTRCQTTQCTKLSVAINLSIISRINPLRRVIIPILTNKNTSLPTFKRRWRNTRMLQSFPANLHHQTLLRIKAFSFSGRKAKKLWVKLINIIQVVTFAYIHFSRNCYLGVKVCFEIPSIIRNIT